MSIPLDRLYHYIESVVAEIYDGDVLIYRFSPHGSKNLQDLVPQKDCDYRTKLTSLEIICHDQEPLNYDYYQTQDRGYRPAPNGCNFGSVFDRLKFTNLKFNASNINDYSLLIHSEQRSQEVEKYKDKFYIPVYYWNHAVLARDWYRYAQRITMSKFNRQNKFLIYNRDWTGTREYRLKLADLLIDFDLVDQCQTSCCFVSHDTHYSQHNFVNPTWIPKNKLEDYYQVNTFTSNSSADFNEKDYGSVDLEVVLETLFDDTRWHLTEKALRPIALGKPFVLAATAGSLQYLKNYGFKTFNSVIDESYDQEIDHYARLEKIVKLLNWINTLPTNQYNNLINEMNKIAEYNRQYFFSNEFFNMVLNELEHNLMDAFAYFIKYNSNQQFINFRRECNANSELINWAKNLGAETYNMLQQVETEIFAKNLTK